MTTTGLLLLMGLDLALVIVLLISISRLHRMTSRLHRKRSAPANVIYGWQAPSPQPGGAGDDGSQPPREKTIQEMIDEYFDADDPLRPRDPSGGGNTAGTVTPGDSRLTEDELRELFLRLDRPFTADGKWVKEL